MKRLASFLTLFATVAVASAAGAEPPNDAPEPRPEPGVSGLKIGLEAAGAGLLTGPNPVFAILGTTGLAAGERSFAWLVVPGGTYLARSELRSDGQEDLATGFLIAELAMRAAGAGMLIASRFLDSAPTQEGASAPVVVAPVVTASGGALTVSFAF